MPVLRSQRLTKTVVFPTGGVKIAWAAPLKDLLAREFVTANQIDHLRVKVLQLNSERWAGTEKKHI
jgi:hypothetical protein